jgi:PQ loop repeat
MEIYKRRQVTGISMTFLAIDISGGILSLLSLVFKDKFDGIAALTYIGVIVSTRPRLTHVPFTITQFLLVT